MKKIFIAGFSLLLAGCVSLTEAFSPHGLDRRITSSQDQWRTMGQPYTGFAVDTNNAYPSPELQLLLNRLVAVSPLKGFKIKAYVVEDLEVNAFSDGGSIYVHRALLKLLNNDRNQTASVMAHELGHIIGNHVKSKITRNTITSLSSALINISKNENANGLITEVLNLGSTAYDRRAETEADIIGAALLHKAGFDSIGLIEALKSMDAQRRADAGRYLGLLNPHVNMYNKAVLNYKANMNAFKRNGFRQGFVNASHWAKIAKQEVAEMDAVVTKIQKDLQQTNPMYLDHPSDEERISIISLIRTMEMNHLGSTWLYQKNPMVGEVYQTLMARSPR